MTLRSVIQTIATIVISVGFVAGGVFISQKLAGSKPSLPKSTQGGAATVFTRIVENGPVPVRINATGALQALERVELFSEVQGVMLADGGKFKAGNRFSTGQTLVSINAADYKANLMSQRSNLLNLLTSALADIRLDFPESFENWNNYVKDFDVNETVAELPAFSTSQEKMFISGRNILSTYYAIKNAEIILSKYNLTAPFSGVLTEAMVTPGTVVRPGQKLGTFINPTVFEMETPVNASMVEFLKIGQTVMVSATNGAKTWEGKVVRINNLIDPTTQTRNAYLQVSGDGLEEGMFLEASISATEVDNAMELPRSLLMTGNKLFITDGKTLQAQEVDPVYFTEQTVIVRGLKDGIQVLTKMPPSAYPGMEVIISQD